MGRDPWSNRRTVEECKAIDTVWLNKNGYFCGFKSGRIEWKNVFWGVSTNIGIQVSVNREYLGGNHVRLFYTYTNGFTGEKTELDYKVQLVTTPCNYGGERYWFICPLVVNGKPCNRRVGKLYLPLGSKYFGCRQSYNLTYKSCKEHSKTLDAIMKNPELLQAYMERNDVRGLLLAIKAHDKMIQNLSKPQRL